MQSLSLRRQALRTEGCKALLLHSPQDTATAAGAFFTVKQDSALAGDQRVDDAGSLTFDSAVLAEECVVLGQPLVKL